MNLALRITATLAIGTMAAFAAGCGSSYDATDLQRCGGQSCVSSADPTLPSGSDQSASEATTGTDGTNGSITTIGPSQTKGPKANTCNYSSECGQNRVCADGACLVPCGESDACASGSSCQKGLCLPSGTGSVVCDDDSSCAQGEACTNGTCQVDTRPSPNCAADLDCGAGPAPKKCVEGFCKFTCTSDIACKQIDSRIGYCAADNVCRTAIEAAPECIHSDECLNGRSCIGNLCL